MPFLQLLFLGGTSLRHVVAAKSSDLSTTTKLNDLVFVCQQANAQRITMALQTVKSRNPPWITLHADATVFINPEAREIVRQE